MTQVIKFPDMRPPSRGGPPREPPPPSHFRRSSPAIIATQPGVSAQPQSRKRLVLWFGVAVALHAALLLAIWLMPPLRIPWSPSPDAWVPVVSLPAPAPVVAPPAPVVIAPLPEKAKPRHAAPAAPAPDRTHGN